MQHLKSTRTIMSLFFVCFFTACQTLQIENEGVTDVNTSPSSETADQLVEVDPDTSIGSSTPRLLAIPSGAAPEAASADLEVQQSTGIWDRMRARYKLIPTLHPRVATELKWYKSHPGYLERIQERAAPYIYFILEELEKRDMPGEIALLPAVESAFQPFAYSPGRAAGIWQFIPATGRGFGLKQNWWYDGRRDVVASTQAALDYLTQLSSQFDGDWELALAAYNSGAGTVRKAILHNRKQGKPSDFWSLELPRETRQYVPRLLAISEIFANPDDYHIDLREIPDEPYFDTVDIDSQLDLALAAEMAELSIQEIYQLNPGFNRWSTAPEGPHSLHLPLDKVAGFKEKLAKLPDDQRVRWERYKIVSGDNLSVIARKHGTTTKLLRQVNKLNSNKIRAGKHLLIPVSTKKLNHYSLSAQQRKTRIQNKPRKGSKQHYIVQQGDSLWRIAQAHRINHRQLAKWNGMAPGDPLKTGQQLVLWLDQPGMTDNLSALDLQPSGIQNTVSYRVKRGDSLSRIAQRFNVSVNELKQWNRLPGKYLQPGQRLKLYVDVTEQTTL